MKTLKYLEKSRSFWSILVIAVFFFFLRLPSIIEPYWYGDEGIYEVIGQALHQGRLLYIDIWDNKPPLLYLTFALFNGNQESVRTLSLIFGILSSIVLFSLSQMLFKRISTSIIATIIFVVLFGTPFLEGNIANAENFMLLPILTAALLLLHSNQKNHHELDNIRHPLFKFSGHTTFLIAGLLLGVAFLYKIVAIFDLAALLLFFLFIHLPRKLSLSYFTHKSFHTELSYIYSLVLGFLIPFLLTMTYFLFNNALKDFIHAAFFGNVGYVGLENKFFDIPQGLLIVKILLLATVTSFIFSKRHKLSHTALFILLWLSFSLFNAFFSQRPYTHYLLVLLPSICLFIGLIIETTNNKLRLLFLTLLLVILVLVKNSFWISNLRHTVSYYQNVVLFIIGQKDVQSYRSFFDPRTPRDYELASFITKHTDASDDVFVWGDSAQIYALSNKLPINKYTVAYHIRQNEKSMEHTQKKILDVKPKFIITLSETSSLPFSVPNYRMRFTTTGATIYERNY